MASLMTAGYSGHDQQSFLEKLHEHGVETIVDVRQNPVSRKKGFSRTSLSAFLSANGIRYRHAPQLGVPSPLRLRLREGSCELAEYLAAFREHLDQNKDALDELCDIVTTSRCCLICLEHRPEECHRSVVADAAADYSHDMLEIVHL